MTIRQLLSKTKEINILVAENKAQAARIAEMEAALRPFAQMDRSGCDLSEIACERGVASDLTIITSGDFRRASDVLNAPTGAGCE